MIIVLFLFSANTFSAKCQFNKCNMNSKISILLETNGGFYFHWRGLKKCFLQFKTLRRVIYIPLEGFRYLSWGFIYPLEGLRYPSCGFIIPLEGFRYLSRGFINLLEGFRNLSRGFKNPLEEFRYPSQGFTEIHKKLMI